LDFLRKVAHLARDIGISLLVVGTSVALYRLGVLGLIERSLELSEAEVSILRRLGVTASLFLGYWIVSRYYERRPLTELAFRPIATLAGAALGIVLIGITILVLLASGNYQIDSYRGLTEALPILGAIVSIGIFEEVLFRGILFRLFEKHMGTVTALVAQAIVFGVLHLFNDGTSWMTMISVTLLGAFWATIYVWSRNLWVVVANHVAWNVTIFGVGLPLSGQEEWRLSAPLTSNYTGPTWLTGGSFGPEDSIINVALMACALSVLVHLARRRGRFLPGSPSGTQK